MNTMADNNQAQATSVTCYHCGLPVIHPQAHTQIISQQPREFCCPSCQAVATMIHQGGLDQFYQYRSELNRRPTQMADSFSLYDREDIQAGFVEHHESEKKSDKKTEDKHENHASVNKSTAHLLLEDITCAACVWLIEKHLYSKEGVLKVSVNASTHQCLLQWDRSKTKLSTLMSSLAHIGYRPQPLTQHQQQQQRKRNQRLALMRLAVAAFGMMQVGMVAIALYAGALQGMEAQWLTLLRWVSLLVATPVVLFSAQPFWSAAWKSLRQAHLTMDVPVSLAIVLAYLASAWATFSGSGEVYFDSVSMFTFFLLLGRYIEMRTRYKNHQQTNHYTQLLPLVARRANKQNHQQIDMVVLAELQVGDLVQIMAGDTIPCDGEVIEGASAVLESLLTGEVEPVNKQQGAEVIAGTVNTDGSLLVKATAVNQQTRLSAIEKLSAFAEQDKPKIQELANQVARYFVAIVLLAASGVYTFWYFYQPEAALWITLSVLVVTCPCALSLATPTVLTSTLSAMRAGGLLIVKGHVIETLAQVNRVIFDKTGTLTYGKPKVIEVIIVDDALSEEDVLSMAAALEQGSTHPIAAAFAEHTGRYQATERQIITGAGVQGMIHFGGEYHYYSLGKPSFISDVYATLPSAGQWILLAREVQAIAWIRLSDPLRKTAVQAITALQQKNIHVEILSGDNAFVVSDMATQLGGIDYRAGATPEDKVNYLRQQQQQSPQQPSQQPSEKQIVLMVGDGINDVPVLAGADVSVAMETASDFTRTHADAVLLNGDLNALLRAIKLAHHCKAIMRQNITWALLYNLMTLPLAASGHIPPYMAAIGMSLSSLIVVLNALRVGKLDAKNDD
ncbi:MAG: Cu2+-exporting ATPase [Candidatus Endobugula sp.]|jgi:Cu2+-exporting ATPase